MATSDLTQLVRPVSSRLGTQVRFACGQDLDKLRGRGASKAASLASISQRTISEASRSDTGPSGERTERGYLGGMAYCRHSPDSLHVMTDPFVGPGLRCRFRFRLLGGLVSLTFWLRFLLPRLVPDTSPEN